MVRIALLIGFVAAAVGPPSARADGLIYKLSKEGESATFEMEYKGTAKDGNVDARKGTFTVSSVGTATIDGKKCRWLEFKQVTRFQNADIEKTGVTKVLIPEIYIGKGKAPGENVIRGWVRRGNAGDVRPLNDKEVPELLLFRSLWLAGPAPDLQEMEKIDVETKPLGTVSCAGSTGTYELIQEGGTGYFTFENRLNEKAPFGLVSSRWKIERKINAALVEEGTITFKLIETGTTALSELLDKN